MKLQTALTLRKVVKLSLTYRSFEITTITADCATGETDKNESSLSSLKNCSR